MQRAFLTPTKVKGLIAPDISKDGLRRGCGGTAEAHKMSAT